ncbi:WhiB family transcriptional regulator [Streptomyces hydrogenans]|uniref:WhiB family transcriptional regulator n=1 Tax=Streptomyces TaxID=1883 RepID=UPI003634C772
MSHLDALRQLTEHRHYAYRGCAPDPDKPRYAAADDLLPLDAWGGSTVDGGLPAAARVAHQKRAMNICRRCPVLDACRAYATSELPGGGIAEPDGIQGGMTRLERYRQYIERAGRIPAGPRIAEAKTPTRLAVLRALAVETDAELVAYKAGMNLRAANWHRSALCSIFGLDKESASREELLVMAKAYGVLPARTRVVPDGPWPVVAAPNTDGTRQRRIAPGRPEQTVIPNLLPQPAPEPAPAAPVRRRRRARTAGTGPGGRPLLTLTHPPAARPVPLPLPVRTLEARAA